MSLKGRLIKLKEVALDLVFPLFCVGCGKEGSLLCPSCSASLPRIKPPICLKCGRAIISGSLCPSCLREPPQLDGIRSPFRFEGIIRDAIHHLKYRNLKALSSPLALLLADYLKETPIPADALVPVPLHPKRIRERGYNQSSLLARELGRLALLPVVEGSLVRRRNTPAQARAGSVEERRRNVSGVFFCDGQLRERSVLLIDDVCTTGATLESCAIALKEAGATSVWGLVLAREI